MPTFDFTGHGRRVGAIGITHGFTATRTAPDLEAARVALYNEWEHISGLQATERPTPDDGGRARCLAAGSVTRYVVTHLSRDPIMKGTRTLATPAQGRYTFATEAEAQAYLTAMLANNPPGLIAEHYGAPLEVRPCECWPEHFDPKGIYFDVEPRA